MSAKERLRLHENLAGVAAAHPRLRPLAKPPITRLASCRFDYLYAPGPETAADLLTKEADTG